MTLKLYLLAFLAAFLIILATAELPTEGNDVLDSDVELDFVKYALQLDQNMAEVKGIRQKREAIADPKKGKGKKRKNSPRKKGNKGRKGKRNNNGKQKPKRKEKKNSKKDRKKEKKKGNNELRQNQKKKGSETHKKPKKSVKNKGNNGRKGGRSQSKNGNKGRKANNHKKGGNRQNNKKDNKPKKGTTGKKSKHPNKGENGKTRKKDKKTKQEKNSEKKTKSKNGKNGTTGKKPKHPRKRKSGKPRKMEKIKVNGEKDKTKLSQRKKKLNKGRRPGPRQSNATVSLTCLRDAVTYTKFLKDNVVNFLRQYSRLTRQIKLTNNKAGKKGEFKIPAARIIQAGGGDRTNLSCGGSATSVGAKKMLEIANFLDGCAAGIKTDCVPPTINKTELELCKTNAVAYNTTVSTCITMATQGKDACSCFQATAVADEKKVLTKCKASSSAKSSAKARSKCLNTLKYCKANVTAAGVLQYACRYSEEELTATLTQLTANSAAFSKFLAKIKSLTGLSGVLPGTTSNRTSRTRAVRNTEEEDAEEDVFDSPQARMRGKREEVACSTVVTSITTCTTAITNTPALTTVVTKCKTPTYTIATCTDADKTAIQAALNTALEKNAIILAFLDAIKAELTATTGSTPSPSDGTGTARVAARSRSLLRKMIMEKMQLRN
eukprot:GFUD01058568.1.p1 GENE.GFUD01058568.1~~GFUD01058568.1.p1  ORF type:complete len:682 (+),score=166.77 GFUD01058568.1:59-2047(+)